MQKTPTHFPSLLSSILFLLSGLLMMGLGLLMGFSAFYSLLAGETVQTQQTILFLAFGFEAVLLFAAAFFAFQKTVRTPSADRTSTFRVSWWQMLVGVLVIAGAILLGNQLVTREPFNWLVIPFLTIPAIVLPLAILFALGTHGLSLSTRWQTWSVFGLGMSLTPLILLMLEAVLGIALFVGVVIYIVAQPELAAELQGLSQQIMVIGPDSEAARELLSPFLTRPGVITIALLYIAVIVPAIEELLKPLAVWLLAGKLDSAAQGFTLGALSGAAYGLVETIGVSGQVDQWAILLFTRMGTGLLHITTSALMGAAIVAAWRERRYLHLIGTYLLAVLLHGLWNALAMLFTFSSIAEFLEQPGPLSTIQPAIMVVMSILAMLLLAILIVSNGRLRKDTLAPLPEPGIPADPIDQTP